MNKRAAQRSSGRPASDLLEEAVRLLRRAPASTLLLHAIGSVPCVLGALYFFADMSRSAFASGRLFESSLVLAALYVWMKSWHAIFAAHLRALLLHADPPRWTPGRLLRLVATQAALQPLGFLLRPAALVLTIPYLWAAIFFHNVTVLGDGSGPGVREVCLRAWQQAKLWPWQLFLLTKQLFLFGFFVWLNVAIALVSLPLLLKMFLGIETVFSRHTGGFLNLTFFAATLAGTYLCVDPIRKAATALRCFHGSSVRSGEDLEVQFRSLPRPLAQVAAVFLLFAAPCARAESVGPVRPIEVAQLDRSIDDVLARREFAWRSPREVKELPKAEQTWWQRWRQDFDKMLQRWTWSLGRGLKRAIDRIEDWFSGGSSERDAGGGFLSWLGSVRYLAYALLAVAVMLLIVQIVRARRRARTLAIAQPVAAQPDLTREDVTADQLPEDGWLQMARDLMDRGELRLALRASYLAGLAHLGQRELIRLARHKSNRDYDRELRRRARAQPELVESFDQSLETFERSWYGEHEVTRATLGDFARHLERIRAC